MFFRADSVTLNTHHTTEKSDKIIFRSTKIIGTLPRIVESGEIGPKSARLSCGVFPALAEINRKITRKIHELLNEFHFSSKQLYRRQQCCNSDQFWKITVLRWQD